MALTTCPSCSKRISDKAKSCQYCGFLTGTASEEDLLRQKRMQTIKRSQSLNNQSLLAMLLFVLGFGYMYWGGTRPEETEYYIAMTCSGIGLFWYVINRVRIVIEKRFK
ncbi:hypothetical protein KIH87_08915 [Paraneptunicella aestuarii]|uniref:hypothetical protein n=1 Tax=Paraneptunicella aestuarii TaxID=2831148 RepID=UPI001E5B6BAE|nr:hypothetical protein [Paraneptunicella aestuarii]UAA40436.1 hypothetical protein KIH87_08915 [Paraneptunicella aestuarii]